MQLKILEVVEQEVQVVVLVPLLQLDLVAMVLPVLSLWLILHK